MAFPTSPTNGQQAIVNGILYSYASATQSWTIVPGTVGNLTIAGNVTANNYIISGTGIFYSNGTAYSSGGGGITYTANTAPPTSGNVSGDQWYNTSTDALFEYQFDGTSYYWIDVTSPSIGNSSAVNTGSTFTGTEGTFTTKVTTSNLATGAINANSTVTVAAITSNGSITGTEGIFTTKVTTSNLATGAINANANATIQGLSVNANATISGNITASYFLGNGSQLTGISGGVTSLTAGSGITVSASTGAVTVSQDIYTGSDATNTSFPIGSYVYIYNGASTGYALNASMTPRIGTNNDHYRVASGTALAGTWRWRGAGTNLCGSYYGGLCQRTA